MGSLIINRPNLQSRGQRIISSILLSAFWMLWIYIWLPLASLFAWGFGVHLFYDEMVLENGFEVFIEMAGNTSMMIIILGTSLLSWAFYNWGRFRNKKRRRVAKLLSNEEMAEYFQVDKEELIVWHHANRIVVHHNEQGDVQRVETGY